MAPETNKPPYTSTQLFEFDSYDPCTCEVFTDPACPVHHKVVSLRGWTCDRCGRLVTAQTDPDGNPVKPGEWVEHALPH